MIRQIQIGAAWAALATLILGANLIGNASLYVYGPIILLAGLTFIGDRQAQSTMGQAASFGYFAAFALLAIALIASSNAPGDAGYMGNFAPWLLFIPAVVLFSRLARPSGAQVLGVLALGGSLISLIVAVYEVKVLGRDRVIGFINLTNPFAMASVMLGYLTLIGFFARRDWLRVIFLLGPVAGCLAAILAGTRGAIVMAAVLSVVFILFWAAQLRGRQLVVMLISTVAIFVIGLLVIAVTGEHVRAFSAFESLGLFIQSGQAIDYSTEVRLNLYHGGLMAFLEAPIFGHGWMDNVEAARKYMSPQVAADVLHWSHLHNDYVNFLALAGVFGFVAYLIYLLTPVIASIRAARDSQYLPRLYGAVALVISYAVFGMFDTAFSNEMPLAFAPIFTAALLGMCVDRPRGQQV